MGNNIFDPLIKIYNNDSCICCHGKPNGVGLFQPKDSIEWGGYQNKQRFIRYCFCEECLKTDGFPEFVEYLLSQKFKSGELTQ